MFLAESWVVIEDAARRALDGGETVRFSAMIRDVQEPMGFTAVPLPGAFSGAFLEARALEDPVHGVDMPLETLCQQLSLINDGVFYTYEPDKAFQLDMSKLLGYPPGHPATSRDVINQLIHPDDLEAVLAHQERLDARMDQQVSMFVCRMRHLDGEWRWIEARERVFSRHPDGSIRLILGFATDVSERHRLLHSLSAASSALLTAESHVRSSIGRELHDSVAQYLVAIDLTLSRLEPRLPDNAGQHGMVRDIREALGAAHREIRTFSYLLHPPDVERRGLESSLRKFLQGFGARTGLEVKFEVEGEGPPIDAAAELSLFRVAQEALMNVHKHAGAASVDVQLSYSPRDVTLEVSDDGVGLSQAEIDALLAQEWGGVGVASMSARMEQLGGRLEICAQPRGLLIRAKLPSSEHGHHVRQPQ